MGQSDERVRKRGGKGAKRPQRDPAQVERIASLVAAGMPHQMAVSVAQGKTDLNDALETLSQRAEVERLMRDHDLTRALATQVVKGHADLDAYLAKRRFEAHRATHRDRSCLDDTERTLCFLVFGGERVEGRVANPGTYEVEIETSEGLVTHHKLAFKLAYDPSDYKRVKRAFRRDKALAAKGLRPAEHPQDRYTCSDKRLFRYVDEESAVEVTLLEGEVITGTVAWFGRFEFGLRVKGDAEVTVFRHALHHIGLAA